MFSLILWLPHIFPTYIYFILGRRDKRVFQYGMILQRYYSRLICQAITTTIDKRTFCSLTPDQLHDFSNLSYDCRGPWTMGCSTVSSPALPWSKNGGKGLLIIEGKGIPSRTEKFGSRSTCPPQKSKPETEPKPTSEPNVGSATDPQVRQKAPDVTKTTWQTPQAATLVTTHDSRHGKACSERQTHHAEPKNPTARTAPPPLHSASRGTQGRSSQKPIYSFTTHLLVHATARGTVLLAESSPRHGGDGSCRGHAPTPTVSRVNEARGGRLAIRTRGKEPSKPRVGCGLRACAFGSFPLFALYFSFSPPASRRVGAWASDSRGRKKKVHLPANRGAKSRPGGGRGVWEISHAHQAPDTPPRRRLHLRPRVRHHRRRRRGRGRWRWRWRPVRAVPRGGARADRVQAALQVGGRRVGHLPPVARRRGGRAGAGPRLRRGVPGRAAPQGGIRGRRHGRALEAAPPAPPPPPRPRRPLRPGLRRLRRRPPRLLARRRRRARGRAVGAAPPPLPPRPPPAFPNRLHQPHILDPSPRPLRPPSSVPLLAHPLVPPPPRLHSACRRRLLCRPLLALQTAPLPDP